jgi:hypothetical protein
MALREVADDEWTPTGVKSTFAIDIPSDPTPNISSNRHLRLELRLLLRNRPRIEHYLPYHHGHRIAHLLLVQNLGWLNKPFGTKICFVRLQQQHLARLVLGPSFTTASSKTYLRPLQSKL